MISLFTVALILYSAGNFVHGQPNKYSYSIDGFDERGDLLFVQLVRKYNFFEAEIIFVYFQIKIVFPKAIQAWRSNALKFLQK